MNNTNNLYSVDEECSVNELRPGDTCTISIFDEEATAILVLKENGDLDAEVGSQDSFDEVNLTFEEDILHNVPEDMRDAFVTFAIQAMVLYPTEEEANPERDFFFMKRILLDVAINSRSVSEFKDVTSDWQENPIDLFERARKMAKRIQEATPPEPKRRSKKGVKKKKTGSSSN